MGPAFPGCRERRRGWKEAAWIAELAVEGAGGIQGLGPGQVPLFMEEVGLPAQLLDKPLASLGLTIAFVEGEIAHPSTLHRKSIPNTIQQALPHSHMGQALQEHLDPLSHSALAPAHGRHGPVCCYLHFPDEEAKVQR